jgi:hypothetical protein
MKPDTAQNYWYRIQFCWRWVTNDPQKISKKVKMYYVIRLPGSGRASGERFVTLPKSSCDGILKRHQQSLF